MTSEPSFRVDFHMAVAEASHNVALVHVMRGIFNLMRINMLRSREALCHQAENVALLDERHAQIAKAIAARDPALARAAATIHLSFVPGEPARGRRDGGAQGRERHERRGGTGHGPGPRLQACRQ